MFSDQEPWVVIVPGRCPGKAYSIFLRHLDEIYMLTLYSYKCIFYGLYISLLKYFLNVKIVINVGSLT